MEGLRLRILTPKAPQRAPFQKDRGPDPWTIVNAVVLNIKNDSFWCIHMLTYFHNVLGLGSWDIAFPCQGDRDVFVKKWHGRE